MVPASVIGLERPLQSVGLKQHGQARSGCAPATGADAREPSADHRCSFTSGVTADLLAERG